MFTRIITKNLPGFSQAILEVVVSLRFFHLLFPMNIHFRVFEEIQLRVFIENPTKFLQEFIPVIFAIHSHRRTRQKLSLEFSPKLYPRITSSIFLKYFTSNFLSQFSFNSSKFYFPPCNATTINLVLLAITLPYVSPYQIVSRFLQILPS